MSILYYAAGTQWWCKRCKTTVRVAATGNGGECRCTANNSLVSVPFDDGNGGIRWEQLVAASPWEPVCRKCLQFYRSRRGEKYGLKRLKLPFSQETVWRFSLFGWTLEWSYGSITTDVSRISA